MSQETNQETVEQFTPEQLEQRRKDLIAYYKNQTSVLEAQLGYETVMANIEEQRVKRMTMIMRQAQLAAPPQEEDEEGENEHSNDESIPTPSESSKKDRKLKTA